MTVQDDEGEFGQPILHGLPDLWETIDRLEEYCHRLREAIVPEDETADAVGHVAAVERRLADWRKGMLAEAAPSEGREYEIVEHRYCDRTYNTGRLLDDLSGLSGYSVTETLRQLVAAGVVKVDWRWTELKRYCERNQFQPLKAFGPVEGDDLDAPHYGEAWKSRLSVEGLPQPWKYTSYTTI